MKNLENKLTKELMRLSAIFVSFLFYVLILVQKAHATGLGAADLHIDEYNFVNRIFQIAFGIAIGSGIILVGVGGLTVATATGNPDKIQEGREQITSALIGLGVVIFSVFILKVLGVDILGLDAGLFFR